MKRMPIDPAAAKKQFDADMEAMRVKPKDGETAPARALKQRLKKLDVATMAFNRWSAVLTEQQTLEDAMDPTFWADHVAKIMGFDKTNPLGRGNIIEVRKLDTGLYAELLIVEIGIGFVRTVLVRSAEPETVDIPESSPLAARWNAGAKSFDVIRKADSQIMRAGFQTKASAAAWIADHVKAMAA